MIGRALRGLARAAIGLLLGVVGVIAGYTGTAFGLMLVPVNPDPGARLQGSPPARASAFVISNGVHAELVFPLLSPEMDWRTVFPPEHVLRESPLPTFISIGWGDRDFYLYTPQWRDLTTGRALRALLGGGPSLVHVTYIRHPSLVPGARKLSLTTTQYVRLVRYVTAALVSSNGRPVHLPGASYGYQDAFYEAEGSYNALNTCNTWIGRGLREAGVEMGAWTPFDVNVLWHLDPV